MKLFFTLCRIIDSLILTFASGLCLAMSIELWEKEAPLLIILLSVLVTIVIGACVSFGFYRSLYHKQKKFDAKNDNLRKMSSEEEMEFWTKIWGPKNN